MKKQKKRFLILFISLAVLICGCGRTDKGRGDAKPSASSKVDAKDERSDDSVQAYCYLHHPDGLYGTLG